MRHTALVFLMRFNNFNKLSISALGQLVILLYVIGCVKYAVNLEDDDRTDIVIYRLVQVSVSAYDMERTAANNVPQRLVTSPAAETEKRCFQ